jgi:hypothetical protein
MEELGLRLVPVQQPEFDNEQPPLPQKYQLSKVPSTGAYHAAGKV